MPSWWVAELWQQSPVLLVSWVFWIIFSIVLHELSHGWVAIRCGDPTPIETGHMTWNPIVHMGVPSLIMFAIAGITWGAMPINPARFQGRHDDAKVAAAGPVMNLFLAIVCVLGYAIWIGAAGGYWLHGVNVNSTLFHNTQVFLRVGTMLNFVLLLFNLLPVPPLDGSKIAASFSASYRQLLSHQNAPQISLIAFIVVFYFGGDVIFPIAFKAADSAMKHTTAVLVPKAGP